ncbi:hypothetical protein N7517_011370 [Penicillium concentricum]|uniref:Uncharacterized protein n=1 Tax=Penicillium concentricum TaxID=293559 RepID=A0A9W9RAS8_9EURO|nr:uncharacterized protein N7517_011370 [Penicillium concentricum]KAJ5356761.1 hypothetical protein N7517_011370 [Penicillium concentricum]
MTSTPFGRGGGHNGWRGGRVVRVPVMVATVAVAVGAAAVPTVGPELPLFHPGPLAGQYPPAAAVPTTTHKVDEDFDIELDG